MDVNGVLVWVVGVGAALSIVRLARVSPRANRGWIGVMAALLAALGLGLRLFPESAGYVGLGLWAGLVLLPSLGVRAAMRAVARQKFGRGRRISSLVRWLHPFDGWWEQGRLLEALEVAERGDFARAGELLERQKAPLGPLARMATTLLFRIHSDWPGMRAWIEKEFPAGAVVRDLSAAIHYARALGETGDLNALVAFLERARPALGAPGAAWHRHLAHLFLFAFLGRKDGVDRLLRGPLSVMPASTQGFWRATADGAAGDAPRMRGFLEAILPAADALTRRAVEYRLSRPLADPAAVLTPESRDAVARLEVGLDQEERYAERPGFRRGRPAVTWGLVALNLVMFALEIARGGSQDPSSLRELGALDPSRFAPSEAWRLVAALFLHYGPLHLTFNMLALLLFGPYLEYALGRGRYLVAYLVSGLAGALLLVGLWRLLGPADHAPLFLGASGCVMGVLGGTAAVLLRGWKVERAQAAWRRLGSLGLIFALQVVFDLVTPGVSFTAHFAGIVVGFAAVSLMPHRVTQPPRT